MNNKRLMLVPVSKLSPTMQDIANLFDIAFGNCVFVEGDLWKTPKKATVIYDLEGNPYDVNTRLPIRIVYSE